MNLLLANQHEMNNHLKKLEETFENELKTYCQQNTINLQNLPDHLHNLNTAILFQKHLINIRT